MPDKVQVLDGGEGITIVTYDEVLGIEKEKKKASDATEFRTGLFDLNDVTSRTKHDLLITEHSKKDGKLRLKSSQMKALADGRFVALVQWFQNPSYGENFMPEPISRVRNAVLPSHE